MKKHVLFAFVLLGFVSVQNTFADFSFKDGEKVEVSGYYISSMLRGDGCPPFGGGIGGSRVLYTDDKYKDLNNLRASVTCFSKSLGILTNNLTDADLKMTSENKYSYIFENIEKLINKLKNSREIDDIQKTSSGDVLLIPSKNFLKNINDNPIYLDYLKNTNLVKIKLSESNSFDVNVMSFLESYLSVQQSKAKVTKTFDSKISIKGTYFHPVGKIKYESPFGDGEKYVADLDLNIIVVDDIGTANSKVVKKYKYLSDKTIASLDERMDKMQSDNMDILLNNLINKVDNLIGKASGRKKEMLIEVKSYFQVRLNIFINDGLDLSEVRKYLDSSY